MMYNGVLQSYPNSCFSNTFCLSHSMRKWRSHNHTGVQCFYNSALLSTTSTIFFNFSTSFANNRLLVHLASYDWGTFRGVTGLDGARANKQVCPSIFEPTFFRKQMYCIEESTCDIVGTFRRTENCTSPCPLPLRTLDHCRSPRCTMEVETQFFEKMPFALNFFILCFCTSYICLLGLLKCSRCCAFRSVEDSKQWNLRFLVRWEVARCFWRLLCHTVLTELFGFELPTLPSVAIFFDWRWIKNNSKRLKIKHV